MRVSRLVIAAVMLCIVMQTVTSRKMKFVALDGGAAGAPTANNGTGGGNCTDRCNGTASNSGPGSYNDTTLINKIANCTTLECKLNATRTGNSGSGDSGVSGSSSGGSVSGGIVCKNDSTLLAILTNYTDKDEDKNRTNTTAINTDYQHKVDTSSGTQVYFTGESGLMKVQAANSSDFVTVKLRKLSDSDGQKAVNFENASWTWVGPTATTRQGIAASVLTTTGTVTIQTLANTTATATFYVEVLTFNETGNFTYGNHTLQVNALSAKISYNITGWPFYNANGSFLYLAVTVNSNKNGLNATNQGVTVGGARVSAPTVAFVDNVQSTVDVFFTTDSDDSSGCQAKLLMVFPQFSSGLYYDPIFSPNDGATTSASNSTTTTTGGKAAVGSYLSFITALLAVPLMLALYQF